MNFLYRLVVFSIVMKVKIKKVIEVYIVDFAHMSIEKILYIGINRGKLLNINIEENDEEMMN